MPSRAKNWCYTLNNFTATDEASLIDVECEYHIYGREVGANGTPHLQGFIRFPGRKSLRQVSNTRGFGRAHLEVARNVTQAILYCKKDNDWWEQGEDPSSQGRGGMDFDAVLTMVTEGASLQEIAQQHVEMFIRYSAGIRALYQLLSQALEPLVLNGPFQWSLPEGFDWSTSFVIRGDSGIGKTQWALTLIDRPLLVTHMDQLRLYDPRRFGGIVFDDMSFSHLPREAQIHLVDTAQPRAIHVRYGLAHLPSGTKKIFTTNSLNIFLNDPAINRRITYFNANLQ